MQYELAKSSQQLENFALVAAQALGGGKEEVHQPETFSEFLGAVDALSGR
ncbi:hypothetical protein [Terrihabitans soli]|nr:hypothetical protein [Terrihabitans soli]